jgi:hypothetical protein
VWRGFDQTHRGPQAERSLERRFEFGLQGFEGTDLVAEPPA